MQEDTLKLQLDARVAGGKFGNLFLHRCATLTPTVSLPSCALRANVYRDKTWLTFRENDLAKDIARSLSVLHHDVVSEIDGRKWYTLIQKDGQVCTDFIHKKNNYLQRKITRERRSRRSLN